MFRMMNKLRNRKGFTLIELIVVLAVLAIIMAIAVPRFLGVQEQAKRDADYATAASIAKAAELYYAQKDEVEPTIAQLITGKYLEAENLKLQSEGNTTIKDPTAAGTLAVKGDAIISVSATGGVSVEIKATTNIKYPK